MSEVGLLLPNTDHLQQVDDYVRGCTISTKYWPPSTWWGLCQSLYYFYQILTSSNMVNIMSEFVLLLPNTDRLQQGEDYVRVCTTSTKYWPPPTRWRLCQVCTTSTKYWPPPTRWRLCQVCTTSTKYWPPPTRWRVCQICTTSTKYWPPSTWWRLCQSLYYFYQILTASNKLKIMSDLYYFYQILTTFNKLTIMLEVALFLRNTDRLQHGEYYVRVCTTSTKYWPPPTWWILCQSLYFFYQILTASNKVKIMSEFVLLLPNTDRLQQVDDYVRVCTTSTKYWPPPTWWSICQSLYYFYQILTASNKVKIMSEFVLFLPNIDRLQHGEVYVRVCTTSTKYWQPPTWWRLCQSLYYFYQILTASNKVKIMSDLYYFYQILTASNMVKIMSEFVLLLPNTDRLQQGEDYVRFVLLLPNIDRLQHGEDYVRVCTTSTKYRPPPTWWSICQRLHMAIAKC